VICKPLSGGGSSNVFIAQDADELRPLSAYLLRYLGDILVQEYIGTPDSEYTVGVLTDLNGEMVDAIGVKRDVLTALSSRIRVPNRTGRKELGKALAVSSGISQGKIGRFGSITEYCKKVALAIGAKGPVNMQCRVVGDTIYIFEINPRFSGTTSLRAMMGFNEPDILIRIHLLGEVIGQVNYREGVILRGLDEQIFGDKKPFEN
jgi:carbamoyl-phosphate synthase large subunit